MKTLAKVFPFIATLLCGLVAALQVPFLPETLHLVIFVVNTIFAVLNFVLCLIQISI